MSLIPHLTVDLVGFQRLLATMDKMSSQTALAGASRELGLLLQRNIVKFTPVKTGGAKNAVQLQSANARGAVVVGAIGYWPSLNNGSRPHVIRPKHAKVLAFKGSDGTVFAKMVNHPGTRGVRAFEKGVAATEPLVTKVLKKHLGVAG